MQTLRALVSISATMAMGMIAGTFALYAHTVMPGLRRTDDRTFIAAFQNMDRAIINPWFMATAFVGALMLTAASAALNVGRPALPWIAVALGLYLVAVVVTIAVNVPLNDAIKAAGDARTIVDPAAVRQHFDEARWAAWNLVRTLTTVGALGCLSWALVLHGRSAA
jgi:uncharacterized membrane protein